MAEAIIGAAYISGGREAALKVTKALSVPIANVDRWSDFGRKVLTPPPDFITKLRPGSIAAIETIIGHKFIRPHLLAQAMVKNNLILFLCQKTSNRFPNRLILLSRDMKRRHTSAWSFSVMLS